MVFNYRGDRVVDNFMTGNYAHRIQVSLSAGWRSFGNTDSGTAAENPPRRRNPPSYHCQLNRMCRTENAYPGYFTLGNFHNPTRKDTAIQAMILLFSLPILHSTSPICLVLPYNPFSSW
jgi:hypothetical protein